MDGWLTFPIVVMSGFIFQGWDRHFTFFKPIMRGSHFSELGHISFIFFDLDEWLTFSNTRMGSLDVLGLGWVSYISFTWAGIVDLHFPDLECTAYVFHAWKRRAIFV